MKTDRSRKTTALKALALAASLGWLADVAEQTAPGKAQPAVGTAFPAAINVKSRSFPCVMKPCQTPRLWKTLAAKHGSLQWDPFPADFPKENVW